MKSLSKKTIICIVGNSGSGKTELSKYLMEAYKIPFISSYTTRSMRNDETNGIEHTFVTEDKMPPKEDMLAYVFFGGYHYWAEKRQVSSDIVSYVIDEDGLRMLLDKFGNEYNIIKIYVKRRNPDVDKERIDRDKERKEFDKNFYDLIIYNDYNSLKEFLYFGGKMVLSAIKNKN